MSIDAGTGLTVLGGALGSAKLLEKMLGPTADYLGQGIRGWTEKRVKNVQTVFQIAAQKLGEKIEEPGSIPAKVLKEVMEEASYCEDALAAEYFGGVLASSRTPVGRDDRGAAFMRLVGRLSAYQIRAHYFFYMQLKRVHNGADASVSHTEGRQKMRIYIPWNIYSEAMDFSAGERPDIITSHAMFGLSREELIDQNFHYGPPDYLKKHFSGATSEGLLVGASALGTELFLWALGGGHIHVATFLLQGLKINQRTDVQIGEGAVPWI